MKVLKVLKELVKIKYSLSRKNSSKKGFEKSQN